MLQVVFHSLEQALLAAEIAADETVPLVLWTVEGAGSSLGPAWLVAVARRLGERYPALEATLVLDCADATGIALGALRSGLHDLRFTGSPEVARKLAAMGARLWARDAGDPGGPLDLARLEDPAAACRQWLATEACGPADSTPRQD